MPNNFRNTGILKAIVIDTNDPSGLNHVRIRIPAIHGLVDKESYGPLSKNTARTNLWVKDINLPWAEVCYPFGTTTPPEINQVVWVAFQNGDPNYPVVIGWAGYEYVQEEEVYTASTLDSGGY